MLLGPSGGTQPARLRRHRIVPSALLTVGGQDMYETEKQAAAVGDARTRFVAGFFRFGGS
jgi:hypothetical protein